MKRDWAENRCYVEALSHPTYMYTIVLRRHNLEYLDDGKFQTFFLVRSVGVKKKTVVTQ